jgi:ribosomal protein S6
MRKEKSKSEIQQLKSNFSRSAKIKDGLLRSILFAAKREKKQKKTNLRELSDKSQEFIK